MPFFSPFIAHIALSLELIALVAGVILLSKAAKDELFCKTTGKIIGGFVVVVSLLSVVCTAYLTIRRCCDRDEMKSMRMMHHPSMGLPQPTPPEEPK